jgi:hypothetical protein
MAERYQLPQSCVPPTTRRKDGGYPPSGGLEGGRHDASGSAKTRSPSKGVTLLLKAALPTCIPSRRGLSLLQHAPRSPLRRGGWVPHVMQAGSEQKKPNRRARCVRPPSGYKRLSTFSQTNGRKGRAAMQAACNRARWAHFSDSQHAQHGGPGSRVMQPARRMLRACNCTATCATTAPPRLWTQYRDSRRPSARPSSASLARRSMRPKMGRQ